jgi:hypothetical protein
MGRHLTVVFLAILILRISSPARAAFEVLIEQPQVTYTFGGQLTIEAYIQNGEAIEETWLILLPEMDAETLSQPVTLTPPDSISATFDLNQYHLRAFSTIEYWFQINLANGQQVESDHFFLFYEDNRFDWQTLEADPFRLHWYDGDASFAEQVLSAARGGMERIQSLVPVPEPSAIEIYAYASAREMQETLLLSGQTLEWIAGHADPDLGVILVSLPYGPAQTLEIKRQIPHELAHVMLYQWLGPGYIYLPQWLNEGLASSAELFPNPDYELLLENAYENDTLLPMDSLCDAFPLEASKFLLAYAQSTDFTWYLHEQYGNTGLETLIKTYANGLGCEQGVAEALGISFKRLEREWRSAKFNENVVLLALENFSPWIVVMAVVLAAPVVLFVAGLRKREAEK